jgi:hypothetical protein
MVTDFDIGDQPKNFSIVHRRLLQTMQTAASRERAPTHLKLSVESLIIREKIKDACAKFDYCRSGVE